MGGVWGSQKDSSWDLKTQIERQARWRNMVKGQSRESEEEEGRERARKCPEASHSFPNWGESLARLCLSPGLEDTRFGEQCEHGSVPELYVQ